MVAEEDGPLRVGGRREPGAERAADRAGVAARQRQPARLHGREVEQQRDLVAVLVAEERAGVLMAQVHLAEQHAVAAPPVQERAQVAQVLVRIRQRLGAAVDPRRVDQERHGVDPEAGEAELHPEAHDLRDLVADARVRDVEVGLRAVEAVQVELLRGPVVGPDARLLVGEDDVAGLLGRPLVAPDVELAVRGLRVRARGLEPRVLGARVVADEVGDHAQAAVARRAHELGEVAEACRAADPRRRSR